MLGPMRLKVSTNVDDVLLALDRFVAATQDVAATRAANKLMDQAATEGLSVASKVYGLSTRKLNDYLVRKYASRGERVASLAIRGKGLPLSLFNPRPASIGGARRLKGVTVTIKGRTVLIPHSFMAQMASGHVGVFARGAYGGKGAKALTRTGESFGGAFVFGRGRLPINELFTVSAPIIFRNDSVVTAMLARVREQALRVYSAELRFARGGA